jgi:hypothetical protein
MITNNHLREAWCVFPFVVEPELGHTQDCLHGARGKTNQVLEVQIVSQSEGQQKHAHCEDA